jgi:hypothetical protein
MTQGARRSVLCDRGKARNPLRPWALPLFPLREHLGGGLHSSHVDLTLGRLRQILGDACDAYRGFGGRSAAFCAAA